MGVIDQRRVTEAFDHAEGYASHAHVQRRIAADLALRIAALDLPAPPKILEIGCGTGFLTAALLACGVDGDWLITDKAPAMVARCQEAIGPAANRRFARLDGEYDLAALDRPFDLICASMAMQWFDDVPKAVSGLIGKLAPGGHLVFNTLTAGTFAEWHTAHRSIAHAAGALQLPPRAELENSLGALSPLLLSGETYVERFADARNFLRDLKAIGASTPRPDHVPLPASQMRRVMRAFEAGGASVSYEVLTCHFRKAD